MQTIQIISLAGSSFFMGVVLYSVWRMRLKEAYALLWMAMGLAFLGISLWPPALGLVSSLVGIQYPPATLFLIMIMSLILITFQYSIVLSKRTDEVKSLTQELSILEERVRKLESGSEGRPSGDEGQRGSGPK